MALTYVIVASSDVTQAMIDSCIENSFASLRHSVSGTDRVVLKYAGDDPAWVATLELVKRTHEEILSDLSGEDWVEDV